MPYIITAEILIVNTIIVTMYCYFVVVVLVCLCEQSSPERGSCFSLPKDCFVICHSGFLAMTYHSIVLCDTNEE